MSGTDTTFWRCPDRVRCAPPCSRMVARRSALVALVLLVLVSCADAVVMNLTQWVGKIIAGINQVR